MSGTVTLDARYPEKACRRSGLEWTSECDIRMTARMLENMPSRKKRTKSTPQMTPKRLTAYHCDRALQY